MDSPSQFYKEKYRPQYHFSPEKNWLNDPNGMVYYEGEYHLFYQYHPFSTIKGSMHWGHAVSKDMIHWEHLPIALEPDELGVIYSGSVVVDWGDTSGFFGGGSGLVAIFTHNDKYPDNRSRQRQSLAYSSDKGRTWVKFEGNPVLTDEEMVHYRDPKVIWHAPTKRWVMALAAGDRVRFFASYNLKEWGFLSDFGKEHGAHTGVWECPDLFELPVDKEPSNKKYVLIVSVGGNPNFPEGSRTQYFIGSFDGSEFKNDHPAETVLWLDFGRDNYAGVSWSDIPAEDGRRIYLGWMSNWKYARVTPTKEWRGAMTIPRELILNRKLEGYRLFQKPVHELRQLRSMNRNFENVTIKPGSNIFANMQADTFEIVAEFALETAKEFGFKVRKSEVEETVIGYDCENEMLYVDRLCSGEIHFFEHFPGKHEGILKAMDNQIKLHLFVDLSSVEVFGNDGEIAITEQIFPETDGKGIELFAKEGTVRLLSLAFYEIKSSWD